MNPSDCLFWPYDEFEASQGQTSTEFTFSTPWIAITTNFTEQDAPRVQNLVKKISNQSLGPDDINEISWLLRTLVHFPLAYMLPRAGQWSKGLDDYELKDSKWINADPDEMLKGLMPQDANPDAYKKMFSNSNWDKNWSWDFKAAIDFARTNEGIDPLALLFLVKRFHLLDSVENNHTEELYDYIAELKKSDPKKANWAGSLVIRQNHYVTLRCDSSLRPALQTAQEARDEVENFIQAESGHDKIIEKAIEKMGETPKNLPVTAANHVMMDLLRFAAERNFLAFSFAVDMFERSNYAEDDSMATMLKSIEAEAAADQVNVHKDINDEGAHENVSWGFLKHMAPVKDDYALEALKIAELVTRATHRFSTDIHELILKA